MQRQVDSVIEKYICEKLFGKNLSLPEIQSNLHGQSPASVALRIARALEGVQEQGGNNKGMYVVSIQETVGGHSAEAWCMSLQQTIEGLVEKWCGVRSSLPVGEHCLTVYGEAAKAKQVVTNPQINDVAIWRHQTTTNGHTGRVIVDGDSTIETIEGNTGPDSGVNRDGDGVYRKHRDIKGTVSMHMMGFIRITYTKVT